MHGASVRGVVYKLWAEPDRESVTATYNIIVRGSCCVHLAKPVLAMKF